MGWREVVVERFFGDIVEARVREAMASEESDRGWWPVVGGLRLRDVGYAEHCDNIADSVEAYRKNPLAFRLIELTTDFVLGKGMAVHSDDAEVQAFVDRFWSHPLNRMNLRQFELCTELSLSGELFVTFHTNPFDGMTYVRLIPAQAVDQIETNPEDLEDELRYHVLGGQGTGVGGRSPIPHPSSPIPYTGRWWAKEDCRHYAVNRLVGMVRGQGDLVPMLPWLRRYKDWLTDRVRINRFKGAFLWDITLKGATKQAILARQAELASPPAPGSVIVHNESEEWRATQPTIDAQSAEPDGKAMRLMVAAGAGVPLHFLAEGESATRATAAEMGAPTYRHFERRQLYFGGIMCDLVGEAIRRSGLFAGRTFRLTAEFQDLTGEDNLRVAQAVSLVARALAQAVEQGIVDRAEARALFDRYCREPLERA